MEFLKIQRHQNKIGGEQLGSLFWWALNSNHLSYSKLESLTEKHGLNKKYLPSEIKPASSFRRAWRHATSKLPEGLMLRQIDDSDVQIVIGLVNEQADKKAQDLDYDVKARIVFDKKTHNIYCDHENGVSAQIRELYSYHNSLTTQDIRAMMLSFLKETSIRIRESGGVYFIPLEYQRTLDALCEVVESVGHNVTYALPIFNTKNSKQTLREIAKTTLDAEINQLSADIAKFDKEKMRDSTLDKKLRAFDDIRTRAKMFSSVLSFKAKSFSDKITELQNSLRADMGLNKIVEIPKVVKPKKVRRTITIKTADAVAGF